MKPTRTQRTLGWITVALLVVLGVGIIFLRGSVDSLDTDDRLINRGQEATTCIGYRQDAIDQWRAIATFEFVHQVDRLDMGLGVDVTLAEQSERAIYALVADKQTLREQQLDLIAEGDPSAPFDCPDIPPELVPPELP